MLKRLIERVMRPFKKKTVVKNHKKKTPDKSKENNGPPDSIYPLW